jgi:hypothetical protein
MINKVKKTMRVISNEAKCPACTAIVSGTIESLLNHFSETHGRKPTKGEIHQFRSYKKRDFKASKYTTSYFKNPKEVSGGAPSLGKKA